VAAELHLAEETFALHLLLQCFEGLVDIVIADENLHAVFLFSSTIDRPNSQGALDHWRTDIRKTPAVSNNYSFYLDPKVTFG
jgi:hypothetical protein